MARGTVQRGLDAARACLRKQWQLTAARACFWCWGGESLPLTHYRPGHALLSFSDIAVYDLATSRWLWQTTSGEAPLGHIEFCAASTQSTNGTYEI
jgi:hypothetical protein